MKEAYATTARMTTPMATIAAAMTWNMFVTPSRGETLVARRRRAARVGAPR
jgi:hypothetical protein